MWPVDFTRIGMPDIFVSGSTNTWLKPAKCSYVYIIFVGSGASGGTALADLFSGDCGGGGGGGSGGVSVMLFPAISVPEALRFSMGAGGVTPIGNGAAGVQGGASSIIALNTGATLFTHGTAQSGGGGGGGTVPSGGVAGAAGSIPVDTAWTSCGFAAHTPGRAGFTGATGPAGPATTTGIVMGGAGGGGVAASVYSTGGTTTDPFGQFSTRSVPVIYDLISADTYQTPFYMRYVPLSFRGGYGADSANAALTGGGYYGGHGAPGCGGGGGGGVNNASATAGYGGRGGTGIAMVWSW